MCDKHKYPKKIDAMMQLFWLVMDGRENRKERSFYYCKECNAYHLTSDRKSKKRLKEDMNYLHSRVANAKHVQWIDASIEPPDFTCDIVALYSENGNYVNYIRPRVLHLAQKPFFHYYDTNCEEVKTDQISYYIELPQNPIENECF